MHAASRPWFATLKTILLFVFCAVPGLFATIFGPLFFFLQGVVKHDRTTMLYTAAVTVVGIALLLAGLGSLKRWPFILVFAATPWILMGLAQLMKNEALAGVLAAAVAFGMVALIRRFNLAR